MFCEEMRMELLEKEIQKKVFLFLFAYLYNCVEKSDNMKNRFTEICFCKAVCIIRSMLNILNAFCCLQEASEGSQPTSNE